MEWKCLLCSYESDELNALRTHVVMKHPKAMFTNVLKRKHVSEVLSNYLSHQHAQPREWLNGEPARCSELAFTIGACDPVTNLDAVSIATYFNDVLDHGEACQCEKCSLCCANEPVTYADVITGTYSEMLLDRDHVNDNTMGPDDGVLSKKACMEVSWHNSITCTTINCGVCLCEATKNLGIIETIIGPTTLQLNFNVPAEDLVVCRPAAPWVDI